MKLIPHPEVSKRTYRTTKAVFGGPGGAISRPVGTLMHRYLVIGTPEELEKYKTARGQYYLEEQEGAYVGQPIQNSREYYEGPMELVFTRGGEGRAPGVAVSVSHLHVQLHGAIRTAEQFGSGVMEHVNKNVANILMQNIFGATQSATAIPTTAQAPQAPEPIVAPVITESNADDDDIVQVDASDVDLRES
jgi:hypothetical protein